MKKIDNFVNLYSVSKTLRFKAIPVGKTQENINAKKLLEEDEERAEKYKKAKKIIDRYHIDFIEKVLKDAQIVGINEYMILYNKREKDDEDKKKMKSMEENFRKQIAGMFTSDKDFNSLFDKKLIEEILPNWLQDEEEINIIKSFRGFKTAFEGFNENRKNMYSSEEKSTAIAFRCVNDNLPKFLSNSKCFEIISEALGEDILKTVSSELGTEPYEVRDVFSLDFFNMVLSNSGIVFYNEIIGGVVLENNKKTKGLNEYINLYNQQLPSSEKSHRLPLLKPLYKQVLSEYEGKSFYIDGYTNSKELREDFNTIAGDGSDLQGAFAEIKMLFNNIHIYNPAGIYVKNGIPVTNLSNDILGDWSVFRNNWEKEYDSINMTKIPQNTEKYEEKRRKKFNAIDSFSIIDIASYLYTEDKRITESEIMLFLEENVIAQLQTIEKTYMELIEFQQGHNNTDELDSREIALIKNYLDSIKNVEKTIKPLLGSGKEPERDEVFYGLFNSLFDRISCVDALYNRIRNYVTRKPYSTDKYKLYFQNPQFLGGWDKNKVADYRATLLRKDDLYYIAVIDKENSNILSKIRPVDFGEYYEVLDYKLIPGASKQLPKVFFSKKGRENYNPQAEIIDIYENESFKKSSTSFKIENCHKIINYYKEAIAKHEWNDIYQFHFSDTETYEDISGFFKEVDAQGYKLSFYRIDKTEMDELVEKGKIYLFQLYNKDFSTYSKGIENLHTMLFKQVFNEDNNGNIKLCGGAELFFRKASIKKEKRIIHPANQSLNNKNPLNEKKTSLFSYNLIKDKRYTENQFEIHIPITLNRTPIGIQKLNDEVRKTLQKDSNPFVIGIDRGERNLLYVCVIDGDGKIVEQYSLNEIINSYKGTTLKTNYHDLLAAKESERTKAREDWASIENIKELKEGYISQVIHVICSLIVKNDAIVAMEDLNSGFKNSRKKVEKQVYQKFEKALIDKLSYMSEKTTEIGENGSVTRGYQLANPFDGFKRLGTQNGFIFYIPAWLTSKIDPVTGFVDLLKPKYTSVNDTRSFIRNMDGILYDKNEDIFEFIIDYTKFPRAEADYRKKWRIYTNGKRIKTFRNPEKNSEWDNKEIVLTDEFKKLFEKYSVNYEHGDLRDDICSVEDKQFYVDFIGLFKLTLQMRNSITGRVDVDYLISPVKDRNGKFFLSGEVSSLPCDADANGAYNIARKALWAIEEFKHEKTENLSKTKISISNKEWLEFVQKREAQF